MYAKIFIIIRNYSTSLILQSRKCFQLLKLLYLYASQVFMFRVCIVEK